MQVASNRPQLRFCEPAGAQQRQMRTGDVSLYAEASERNQLRWYACELRARASENLEQSARWENRTEWRDIPLLGVATTVAGLLLFGHRDADNVLTPRTQNAISILGFSAAAFSTFANYLSPATARRLLRQAARGHYCMAGQADLILSVWDDIEQKQATRDTLEAQIVELNDMMATVPANSTGFAQVVAARDAGLRALSLYDQQKRALLSAPVYMGQATWNFGIKLMESADRTAVNVEQLVQDITTQARSIARFAAAEDEVDGTPAPPAAGEGAKGLVADPLQALLAKAQQVAGTTRRLADGLVNVDALVLGITTCASTALTGGEPKISEFQRIGLN